MDKYEFKNMAIELEESSNPKISIDGKPIHVRHDEDANEFNASELPYRSFESVKDLAEELVEQLIQHEQDGEA